MTSPLALLQAADVAKSSAEGRLELWGGYFLADPWFLVLFALLPFLCWRGRASRRHPVGGVPVLPEGVPRSLAQRLAWMPRIAEVLAASMVVVALARPLRSNVELNRESEGIDIALLVDRSTSMTQKDLDPTTGRTRLDVVKEVVGEFATRRMTDREGAADACGLIVFARYPQMACPFTLDADALVRTLDGIEFAEQWDAGTGIGIALAKAVAVLKESEAKSRIVVLLTDGENNQQEITPLEAGEMAAEEGIKVYTIFAGLYASDRFGRLVEADGRIDTTELETIAERTGGVFFRARDKAALEDVYQTIEDLERTPREDSRFAEFFELYEHWLVGAIALYLLSWLSACTWARRLP